MGVVIRQKIIKTSIIFENIKSFLFMRGLHLNNNLFYFKFGFGQSFNFLGFVFKCIKKSRITRLTIKVNKKNQIIKPKTGLFVYVSNESIKNLKFKINYELKFLSKSIYQIIKKLNFIIKIWSTYFAIGSSRTFSKIDSYIFKRCFRFVYKKFPRMGKKNIANNFFLYKLNNISWNFHAPLKKVMFNSQGAYIYLIRICSNIKFVSFIFFKPKKIELKNPFIFNQVNNLWINRINFMRYKFLYKR